MATNNKRDTQYSISGKVESSFTSTMKRTLEWWERIESSMSGFTRVEEKAARETSTLSRKLGESTDAMRQHEYAAEGAAGAVERAGREEEGFGGKLGEVSGELLKSVGVVLSVEAAFDGLKDVISDCVRVAEDEELADKALYQQLTRLDHATSKQVDSLKDYAAQQQALTGIRKDAIKHGMAELASFHLSYAMVKKLTPAMDDFVAHLHVDKNQALNAETFTEAADLIGKSMNGNALTMRRDGVLMTKAELAILKTGTAMQKVDTMREVLEGNWPGFADRVFGASTQGKIAKMDAGFDDVKETIGNAMLPIMGKLAGWVDSHMPQIEAAADSLARGISAAGPYIDKWLKGIDQWFSENKGLIEDTATTFMEIFRDNKADIKWWIHTGLREFGHQLSYDLAVVDELLHLVRWFFQESKRESNSEQKGLQKVTDLLREVEGWWRDIKLSAEASWSAAETWWHKGPARLKPVQDALDEVNDTWQAITSGITDSWNAVTKFLDAGGQLDKNPLVQAASTAWDAMTGGAAMNLAGPGGLIPAPAGAPLPPLRRPDYSKVGGGAVHYHGHVHVGAGATAPGVRSAAHEGSQHIARVMARIKHDERRRSFKVESDAAAAAAEGY